MSQTAANEKLNLRLTLSDGRQLGFAEYGDPDGAPLFYFHGWPGSRFEPGAMRKVCADLHVRMLAPDRPGLGLSDFKPGRALTDWAADVCELADHLQLNRFSVLGVSGGGPYAAACAARIPERLEAILLVSSVAPTDAPGVLDGMVSLNRWLLRIARTAPWLAQRIGAACLRAIWKHGDQVLPEQILRRLPELDRQTLNDSGLSTALIASSREAFRNGHKGAAWDGFLYARPWGFRLEEIPRPVHLWHGLKDVIVPPRMGRHLAETIPNCASKFHPGDGHFSLPFGRIREILAVLQR